MYLLVNELGMPVDFLLTGGHISDYTPAIQLLGTRRAEAVLADKGHVAGAIVAHVETTMQAKAVIPTRSNCKHQRRYDKAHYELPDRIESCFSKLKQFRRFATR